MLPFKSVTKGSHQGLELELVDHDWQALVALSIEATVFSGGLFGSAVLSNDILAPMPAVVGRRNYPKLLNSELPKL